MVMELLTKTRQLSKIYFLKMYFLQGVDPDAPEEDEDNEVEDADGDQDETELL